jgi:hypothetical protein
MLSHEIETWDLVADPPFVAWMPQLIEDGKLQK